LASGVAVTYERGLAMLAVSVQLPVVVLPVEPDASAGSASASKAQMVDTTDLVLMAQPPLARLGDRDDSGSAPGRPPLQKHYAELLEVAAAGCRGAPGRSPSSRESSRRDETAGLRTRKAEDVPE
jgi:hypothetical protein